MPPASEGETLFILEMWDGGASLADLNVYFTPFVRNIFMDLTGGLEAHQRRDYAMQFLRIRQQTAEADLAWRRVCFEMFRDVCRRASLKVSEDLELEEAQTLLVEGVDRANAQEYQLLSRLLQTYPRPKACDLADADTLRRGHIHSLATFFMLSHVRTRDRFLVHMGCTPLVACPVPLA